MPAQTSYVHGVSSVPLLGKMIGGLFDETVAAHGAQEALVVRHQGVRWTYDELQRRVDSFAAGLVALGLAPGDRVGILSPNCAEWVVVQFATAKAGLILVNVNPAYRVSELENALTSVGVKALITATAFKRSDYLAMIRELAPEVDDAPPGDLRAARLPDLRILISIGDAPAPAFQSFDAVSQLGGPREQQQLENLSGALQFDDPINIQFTSGTTGLPKAATLTHHNIVNNAYFCGLRMQLTAADRLCIPVPMYHCFGMVLGTLCCVAHGATMVFSSAGFDAHAVLETVAAERCTALHGVPTM
ncbi:MAG: AMP-binding protein, partial [Alphaproteobacteria bacterium]|nr:AMP-binding protein [Alphaproteobacteria bacterium]